MLSLDEYGLVKIDPDVASTQEVSFLRQKDKTKGKTDFAKWITYAYHLYKRDHILSNFGPKERLQRVISMYFQGEDISIIENMEEFQAFKKLYLDMQHSPTSRFIENLKQDMESVLEHIRTIPITKKALVEVNGQRVWQDTDNSEEKFQAFKRAENLINLYDKFNERLKTEQREEKKKSGTRRLFDHKG